MIEIIAALAEEAALAEAAAAAEAASTATTLAPEMATSLSAPPIDASSSMPQGMPTPGLLQLIEPAQMAPPPMSFGQQMGNVAGNAINQTMAPAMEAYNTFTNPNSTPGDMLSSAYKYSFSPQGQQDEQLMAPRQFSMGGGGMGSNYVGGIPSLLQGYGGASQGILPYIAGR
jgi:hypothetical protein